MSTVYTDEDFENIAEELANTTNHFVIENVPKIALGTCPKCKTIMNREGVNYTCGSCGLVRRITDETVANDNNGRKASDYTKIQLSTLMSHLNTLNQDFAGAKFPKEVLSAAASEYNKLQHICVQKDGGEIKPFVRRCSVRDAILAAVIANECRRLGCARTNKEISEFMRLSNRGISFGESILRDLRKKNYSTYELSDAGNTDDNFIRRYIEALDIIGKYKAMNSIVDNGLNDEKYILAFKSYITDMLTIAKQHKIQPQRLNTTRVVAIVAIMAKELGLNISDGQIDTLCNVRVNTFRPFMNELCKFKLDFAYYKTF